MRETLYRGKRIDNGEWFEGFYFEVLEPTDCGPLPLSCISNIVGNYKIVSLFTVGQYIGIKDKNNTKVFEGDIVKGLQGTLGSISFLQQEMGYVVTWKDFNTRLGHRSTGSWYEQDASIEIVGNVHDSPELLA